MAAFRFDAQVVAGRPGGPGLALDRGFGSVLRVRELPEPTPLDAIPDFFDSRAMTRYLRKPEPW